MRHDETRDNTTAIENQIREADAHEDVRGGCRRLAIHNSRHIRLVEERHPEHNDGANGYDEDEPEDDGQPSEYEEWQDFMGGDDWDHGQYDECGY
jgi:hypothetical protein